MTTLWTAGSCGERVERLAVVVQGEAVGDDAVGLRPAGPQRGDRRAERGDLGERALDGDLAAEDVERVERTISSARVTP